MPHDDKNCRECAVKQAQIDRLMLEYCPDEMTEAQVQEWRRHQKPVDESARSADGRSVGNSEQVQKDWNDAFGQLDAIAKVLGYPRESWRIAGCEFLAHAVRDLQNNYIAQRDAYAGLKGTTDALLADSDRRKSAASSVRATLPEAACKAIVHDMRPSDEAVQIAEGKGKLKLGESYSKLCDEILRLAKEAPASATDDTKSFAERCLPAARVWADRAERAVLNENLPAHYKPVLVKESERATALLLEIETMLGLAEQGAKHG
jgi:hypothetical protein